MSDANFDGTFPDTKALYLSDEALKQGVDLLFLAAREVAAEGGRVLAGAGLGRAHGRALLGISRRPGLSVADLLRHLKVTKQSLNRVLGELIAGGFVERRTGEADRRVRRLFLTETGTALDAALWQARRPLIAAAFKAAGPEAVEGFRKVAGGLIGEGEPRREGVS